MSQHFVENIRTDNKLVSCADEHTSSPQKNFDTHNDLSYNPIFLSHPLTPHKPPLPPPIDKT